MKPPALNELSQFIGDNWSVLLAAVIVVSAIGVPLLNLAYRNRLAEKDAKVKKLQNEKNELKKRITALEARESDSLPLSSVDTQDLHSQDNLAQNQPKSEFDGPTSNEVKWFVEREKATANMKSDVIRFEEVVFVGVSHTKLSTYLNPIIEGHKPGELPWSEVTVYFASDEIGELYEGAQFFENMRRSRHDLSTLFTGDSMRRAVRGTPPIIRFRQRTTAAHFDGVLMKNVGDSEPCVAYAVQAVPRAQGDNTKAVTYRVSNEGLTKTSLILDHIISGLSEIHEVVSSGSKDLGSFRGTTWDESVKEWAALDEGSRLNKDDFDHVMDYIKSLGEQHHIIDAACGSGGETVRLVRSNLAESVVALEASPQMLHRVKQSINEDVNVQFALCSLPESTKDTDRTGLDLGNELASLIIVHNSIHSICPISNDLLGLAKWCFRRTSMDGSVVISGHNGTFELPKPADYENWVDTFRVELETACRSQFPKHFIEPLDRPKLVSPGDLKEAFLEAGFELVLCQDKSFPITMDARRLLWRVPAVAGTIVDLSKVCMSDFGELVDEVSARLEHWTTMPRTVRILHFRKASASNGSS